MKYAIVYVICIICLFGVGVLMWRTATRAAHSERESTMTLQTLAESWKTSGAYSSVEDPATEADIKTAEATIGAQLPPSLREVYPLFGGGWMWDLDFYQLDLNEHGFGLVNANEKYVESGWHIPKEIRLFAHMGGEEVFGIWLPETDNPIFNHPIIEVGELFGEGCMGIAGTNLLSFLRGWSAYQMMGQHAILEEVDKSKESEFLDKLQVPRWLRYEHFDQSQYEAAHVWDDPHFTQLRKWADPQLPDPSGSSYNQEYTIADLKRIFDESK